MSTTEGGAEIETTADEVFTDEIGADEVDAVSSEHEGIARTPIIKVKAVTVEKNSS